MAAVGGGRDPQELKLQAAVNRAQKAFDKIDAKSGIARSPENEKQYKLDVFAARTALDNAQKELREYQSEKSRVASEKTRSELTGEVTNDILFEYQEAQSELAKLEYATKNNDSILIEPVKGKAGGYTQREVTKEELQAAETRVETAKKRYDVLMSGGVQGAAGGTGDGGDAENRGVPLRTADALARAAGEVVETSTTSVTGAGGGTGTGAGGGVGVSGADLEWRNWLKLTFKTLDPKYKSEIDKVIQTAIAQGWDEQKTANYIFDNTSWGREQLPSVQQYFILSNDPRKKGQFKQTISNKKDDIKRYLEAKGVNLAAIDPAELDSIIEGISVEALKMGMTDDQLDSYIAKNKNLIFTGGGTIGKSVQNIQKQAWLNGQNLSATDLATISSSILDPFDSKDENYWLMEMNKRAIDQYGDVFGESLRAGRSLFDATAAERSAYAKSFDVASDDIPWDELMSFVIGIDEKGNRYRRQGMDLQKAFRGSDKWQGTLEAKNIYENLGNVFAAAFGAI